MTTFNKLTANMVYTLLVATRLIGLITNRCSGKESALSPEFFSGNIMLENITKKRKTSFTRENTPRILVSVAR